MVVGASRYVADHEIPGAASLQIVRSDIPRGELGPIDTAMALDTPGVLAVYTAADFDEIPRIPIRVGSTPGLENRLQPVIAAGDVRYAGEPIAVVVAETAAAAEQAAGLVFAEIEPLPVAPPFAEPFDVMADVTASSGDLAAAFNAASTVCEVALTTARKTGLPLEPRAMVARWTGDLVEVWGPTKFVDFTRVTLAAMLAVNEENVVCHRVDVGGMFGVRGEFYPEDYLVPWTARRVGRPVRWEESRRQHLTTINHAGAQQHRIRIGLDASGRPLAIDADVVVEAGAYARPIGSRIAHIVVETMPGPYDWDAFSVRCRTVASHRTPTGTVRGPGAFETTFARERALDTAAVSAGLDPLEVRLSGLIPAAAIPFRRPAAGGEHDVTFDSGDFAQVVEGVLSDSDYDGWIEDRNRRRQDGEAVGIGVGFFAIHSGLGNTETVEIDLTAGGRFLIRTATTDVGQGLDQMAASVLASELGIPLEIIDVWSGDSEALAGGGGTFSSRSTVFVANALVEAAEAVRAVAAERAAELLGVDPSQVRFEAEGPVAGSSSLEWKEVAPITAPGTFTTDRPTYGFGVHIAMVSVDRETGVVVPERMAIGYDCGRALDPANVVAQIRGAAVAGIGAALFEQLRYDAESSLETTTLADYLLPTSVGLPTIDVSVFETAPSGTNPLGIKGVGEAGVIGAGASIANAVADALGPAGQDLVRSIPIDRERIALAASGAPT